MKYIKIIFLLVLAISVISGCKKTNTPPVAVFTIDPETGSAGTDFVFDASGSNDEEDAVTDLMVRWDWQNDGEWDTDYSTEKITSNLYLIPGSYTINMEVKDSEGLSSNIRRTIEVSTANGAPAAPSILLPLHNSEMNDTFLKLSWKCVDPEGDPLKFDIYFGLESDPELLVTDWDSTTYQPEVLSVDNVYYWKIVAKDNQNNTTESNVWSFTTGMQQYDKRDGRIYETVKIGNQYWIATNLDFETASGSMYYNNDTAIGNIYGRLYNWDAASVACINGWHLPSDEEWMILEKYAGMPDEWAERLGLRGGVAGKRLKSTSLWTTSEEYENAVGTDEYGFNVLPAGSYWVDKYFEGLEYTSRFWTSTEKHEVYSYYRVFNYYTGGIVRTYNVKTDGYSVRCIRD
ncbi:FISUMP domain-containing protein [Bacteroidota bacterium]